MASLESLELLSDDRSLSVVIPTYNEAHRLPQTLDEILPYLAIHFPRNEVIVVDDNSPDGTAGLVEKRAEHVPGLKVLVQPQRLGKGAALRRGCLAASGDMILYMDADHATPITEIEGMIPMLQVHNVVVGVRTYQENEPRWRRIIGIVAQLLAHLIVFRKAVVDSQCGFKLFSRDAARRLFPYCRVNGGMIDVELFFLMHASNISCFYQAVHWVNKAGSRINILQCIILDPLDMFSIRIRDAMSMYARPVSDGQQPWGRTNRSR